MRQRFEQLEYHIVDACNFSCRFCAHYSDLHVSRKKVSLEEAVDEWLLWNDRIVPDVFWILGGEPTIHSDLCSFIVAAKSVWRNSKIGLVTNGTLIDRHYSIGQLLSGNRLAVSLHGVREDEILARVKSAGHPSIEIRKSSENWRSWYRIVDGVMMPFNDADQRMSWENCSANKCKILRDGKIWKCPQVALASSVGIDWFSDYCPLHAEATDEDVRKWFSIEDESCCSRCPSGERSKSILVQIDGKGG